MVASEGDARCPNTAKNKDEAGNVIETREHAGDFKTSGENCLALSALSCFALAGRNLFNALQMKTLALLILCVASVALADDFKTIDGKEYKNATVSHVEPDGIVITFSGGIVKLPFVELSPDVQTKYGYDSQAAATYATEQNQKQVALQQQRKEDENKRTEERHQYWSEHSTPVPAERQSVASSMHGSALDQRPVDKRLIYGEILQTVDEGLLVSVLVPAYSRDEVIPARTIVLLVGNFSGFYDNDRIQVTGTLIGPHNYTAVWHYKKTVRAFEVAQINKLH